ncbi:MAG TPA: hypothetical protein VMI94_20625 [Bryobacteraceae bacterium]|nr:hypothetical protein [Bryobacteraceae bacterium]
MSRDTARGLIFLADGDGIWILQRHPAQDPAAAAAYARYLMYNH